MYLYNIYITFGWSKYVLRYPWNATFTEAPKELFVSVEVLLPIQPNGVMSSAVSLLNHTFTGQA